MNSPLTLYMSMLVFLWIYVKHSFYLQWKGTETTIAEYYKKRYNLVIKDLKQPLLISNPNARQRRAGITEPIKLVPELCHMTGLSDEQRADFKLMKAVNGVTLGDPKNRVLQLNKFSQRVTSNENIKKELLEWDMVRILSILSCPRLCFFLRFVLSLERSELRKFTSWRKIQKYERSELLLAFE